jgi:hypothetical protein
MKYLIIFYAVMATLTAAYFWLRLRQAERDSWHIYKADIRREVREQRAEMRRAEIVAAGKARYKIANEYGDVFFLPNRKSGKGRKETLFTFKQ